MVLTNNFLSPNCRPVASSFLSRHARNPVVCVRATASARERRPQNVQGNFFVDNRCIDCDTCRWMAPEVFTKDDDGFSSVKKQPSSMDETTKALQALICCPVNAIRTEKPMKEILDIHKTFPLQIDENSLPGIYHLGYHYEKSYGAASYLIVHPEGNIMVDCPRYFEKLVQKIEKLGGIRYLFLTHKDDIGEHDKWAQRFQCERILHSEDVEEETEVVERKLNGHGPWTIGTDFELVHTPGHTKGSACLFYKPLQVLFTGDHLANSSQTNELDIFVRYNKDSVSLQLESVRKFIELDFQWILPGHGKRFRYENLEEKNLKIEEFVAISEKLFGNVKDGLYV